MDVLIFNAEGECINCIVVDSLDQARQAYPDCKVAKRKSDISPEDATVTAFGSCATADLDG